MLKSTEKIVKLLKSLPKIKVSDDKKFMEQLWRKIRRYESGRDD